MVVVHYQPILHAAQTKRIVKVRTILYHYGAQKDTLRDALRITITLSYSFLRRTVCPVYGVIFGYFYGIAFLIS